MPSSRTAPPVVVAGLLTVALWLVTAQAADWVHARYTYLVHSAVVRTVLPHPTGLVVGGEPLTGGAVLVALLAGAVAAAGTFLAVRRLPLWTGRWAAFLGVWFCVVAAAAVAGTARGFAGTSLPWTADHTATLLGSLLESYWGLVNGWVVGLAVVVTLALTDRRDDPAGSRHARALPRVRALPAVLTAVTSAVLLWAGVGLARDVLLLTSWVRDVVPVGARVPVPAMSWGERPQDLLDRPVELALLGVVALVVGVLAALATRRLPPATGRVALGFAVWFACVAAAGAAATVRVVADRLAVFGSVSGPDLHQILPRVQDALSWGVAVGWVVAVLTVLVHRQAGVVVPPAGSAPSDPWPAPAAPARAEEADGPGAASPDGAATSRDATAPAAPEPSASGDDPGGARAEEPVVTGRTPA